VRFGVVIASWGVFAFSLPSYVIYNIGPELAFKTTVAGFIEMLISGIVLGLVYKPAPAASTRGAKV